MSNRKNQLTATTSADLEAKARKFDAADFSPRFAKAPAAERKRHDAAIRRTKRKQGRPPVEERARRVQITIGRTLLSKADRVARKEHISLRTDCTRIENGTGIVRFDRHASERCAWHNLSAPLSEWKLRNSHHFLVVDNTDSTALNPVRPLAAHQMTPAFGGNAKLGRGRFSHGEHRG
jgi:hypothetical protein